MMHRPLRGQALVEVALSMPLLLGLLSATVHFGILFFAQVQLDTGIRAASLFAAYHPEADGPIETALMASLPEFMAAETVTLRITTSGTRSQGDPLVIHARCSIRLLEALPTRLLFKMPTDIAAETTTCILVQSGR